MKNTLLPLALAAAGLLALPNVGHAQATDGMFINGNDAGYGINVGYCWAVSPSALIGFEGGHVNLGKYAVPASATYRPPIGSPPVEPATYTGSGSTKVDGSTIGANGHFNLWPHWYIDGRAGFLRASVNAHAQITGPDESVSQYHYSGNADGGYACVGVG